MDKCKYNHHLFLLSQLEKKTFSYYTHALKPNCPQCPKSKYIKKIVKHCTSKTLQRVSAITGAMKYNDSRCQANDNFHCNKCDYYF